MCSASPCRSVSQFVQMDVVRLERVTRRVEPGDSPTVKPTADRNRSCVATASRARTDVRLPASAHAGRPRGTGFRTARDRANRDSRAETSAAACRVPFRAAAYRRRPPRPAAHRPTFPGASLRDHGSRAGSACSDRFRRRPGRARRKTRAPDAARRRAAQTDDGRSRADRRSTRAALHRARARTARSFPVRRQSGASCACPCPPNDCRPQSVDVVRDSPDKRINKPGFAESRALER